jgi:hypothetical protein
MKTVLKKICIVFYFFFASPTCNYTTNICTGLTDAVPITEKIVKGIETSTSVSTNLSLVFNPLILPVKIVYTPKKGLSVVHSGEETIVTPIGTFGVHYSVGSQKSKKINNYEISEGDYLVGIVNRNKNTKELFKIKGFNRLKVTTKGMTSIDAQLGYVEIDVTKSKIEEIKFIDNSKISIINTTDKIQKISFIMKDEHNVSTTLNCEIEPFSYKTYPRFESAKSVNETVNMEYYLKIDNIDKNNNLTTSLERKMNFGESWLILSKGDKITIQKK